MPLLRVYRAACDWPDCRHAAEMWLPVDQDPRERPGPPPPGGWGIIRDPELGGFTYLCPDHNPRNEGAFGGGDIDDVLGASAEDEQARAADTTIPSCLNAIAEGCTVFLAYSDNTFYKRDYETPQCATVAVEQQKRLNLTPQRLLGWYGWVLVPEEELG